MSSQSPSQPVGFRLSGHCFRSRSAGLPAASCNPGLRPGLQISPKGEGDLGLIGRPSRRRGGFEDPAGVGSILQALSAPHGLISRFPLPVTQRSQPWTESRLAQPTLHPVAGLGWHT